MRQYYFSIISTNKKIVSSSKFNHLNQQYQLSNGCQLTDCGMSVDVNNNNNSMTSSANNGNMSHANNSNNVVMTNNGGNNNVVVGSNCVTSSGVNSANEYHRKAAENGNNSNMSKNDAQEDDDDVNSLNINFDDVNDNSDGEDFYRSGCDTPNALTVNSNGVVCQIPQQQYGGVRVGGNAGDPCSMYDLAPHYAHLMQQSHHHQATTSKQSRNTTGSMTTTTTSNSSMSNSYLASSTTTSSLLDSVMDNSSETDDKPNRNVHCLKEKLRR
jgi:hypothetical protein